MGESIYLMQRRERELGIKSSAVVPEKETLKTKIVSVKKKSDKRKSDEKKYRKIVKEMLAGSNICEMKAPGCTHIATGLQHKKRRGINYLNKKYLIRSCNNCNQWAENHPKEAMEMGLAISVHKIEQQ